MQLPPPFRSAGGLAAAQEHTPPLGLGDMTAATDRDVAPTPKNPTPPPDDLEAGPRAPKSRLETESQVFGFELTLS